MEIDLSSFAIINSSSCKNGILLECDGSGMSDIFYSFSGRRVQLPAKAIVTSTSLVYSWQQIHRKGYAIKWPMKKQAPGRKTKRYFVLKGTSLCYFSSEDNSKSDPSVPSVYIGLNGCCSVMMKPYRGIQRIELRAQNNILWFTTGHAAIDESWIRDLNIVISGFKAFLDDVTNRNIFAGLTICEFSHHTICRGIDVEVTSSHAINSAALFGEAKRYSLIFSCEEGLTKTLKVHHRVHQLYLPCSWS